METSLETDNYLFEVGLAKGGGRDKKLSQNSNYFLCFVCANTFYCSFNHCYIL